MNIFLLPYTWHRHLASALWCGGAGLLAWWWVLFVFTQLSHWPPGMDGPILMASVAGSVAVASLAGEGNLRRNNLFKRIGLVALGGGLTVGFTVVWYMLWHLVSLKVLFGSGDYAVHANDPSLVSFTFRVGAFFMGGLSSGMGPMVVRKGAGWLNHMLGGVAAGLAAAIAWHLFYNTQFNSDLYLSGPAMGLAWGFVYGLLVWGVPDELYAGWVRVLTPSRFARRIPIDAVDRSAKERFLGHFPRGLDLFLPVEEGVQELHVSIAVDDKQRYKARGLSLAPTRVKRFLERVDLRYDPRRPAPLETRITSGDHIILGQGERSAEVEFLMLPREER